MHMCIAHAHAQVTLEKEHKLRSLMVMMGLRMRWYWLCEWLTNTFIQLVVAAAVIVVGTVVGLPLVTRSVGVWVVLLFEWCQVGTCMCMCLCMCTVVSAGNGHMYTRARAHWCQVGLSIRVLHVVRTGAS